MILFNYIFNFYSGEKKIKQASYKTAQINNITIHLNQKIMKDLKTLQAMLLMAETLNFSQTFKQNLIDEINHLINSITT